MADQQPIVYDDMMQALRKYEDSTGFETNDLTQCTYARDSEFGSLSFNGDKYNLNEWSARQLCRLAHVPFGAFKRASEQLASDMLKEFIPSVKDPQVKLAVKYQGSGTGRGRTLRGILPVEYPDLRNSQVLAQLEDLNEPFVVEAAPWLDKTNPSMLRTRVLFTRFKADVNGDAVSLGLDFTMSELGDGPLQFNVLLFREICSNGAIATYGKKPYFYYSYDGAFSFDVGDIMKAALNRVNADVPRIIDATQKAQAMAVTMDGAKVTINSMMDRGILNKGVAVKVLASLEKDGVSTLWDLVNAITAAARGFRDDLRLRYERAGGMLLGLRFDRSSAEDEFAAKAAEHRDDFLLPG